MALHPAHDLAVQALSGFLSVNDGADGMPVVPGMPSADMAAGLNGLSAVLMALIGRQTSGKGDYIDISMFDAVLPWCAHIAGEAISGGASPVSKTQRSLGGAALYNVYATADDKHIVLGGRELKFATNLLTALDRLDLLPLASEEAGQQAELIQYLRETFATKTRDEWVEWFAEKDIAFSPVLDFREALAQGFLQERGPNWAVLSVFIGRGLASQRRTGIAEMTRLIDLNMHRIGKAITWMIACGNLKHAVIFIKIAAQNAEHGIADFKAQICGEFFRCRNRLNILGNPGDRNFGMLLNLAKQGGDIGVDFRDGIGQIGIDPGHGHGDRTFMTGFHTLTVKNKPFAFMPRSYLVGDLGWNFLRFHLFKADHGIAGILHNLTNIAQRLVQGAAARNCGLNNRAGPVFSGDQPFGGQLAQRFSNGEAAHMEFFTKRRFGWKFTRIGIVATKHFFAQFFGKLQITWFFFGERFLSRHIPALRRAMI